MLPGTVVVREGTRVLSVWCDYSDYKKGPRALCIGFGPELEMWLVKEECEVSPDGRLVFATEEAKAVALREVEKRRGDARRYLSHHDFVCLLERLHEAAVDPTWTPGAELAPGAGPSGLAALRSGGQT